MSYTEGVTNKTHYIMETINEALELLRIMQNNMGPNEGDLDDDDFAHWSRIRKCREGLEKLKQQEPVGDIHGGRITLNTNGGPDKWRERKRYSGPLYAAPVPAAVPDDRASGYADRIKEIASKDEITGDDKHRLLEVALSVRLMSPKFSAPNPDKNPEAGEVKRVKNTSEIVAAFQSHPVTAVNAKVLLDDANALSVAPAAPDVPLCEWSCSDDESAPNTWDGCCGIKWSFIDDGPTENGVLFCPKCGGTVKIVEAMQKGGE